jgi:hypothetical protein
MIEIILFLIYSLILRMDRSSEYLMDHIKLKSTINIQKKITFPKITLKNTKIPFENTKVDPKLYTLIIRERRKGQKPVIRTFLIDLKKFKIIEKPKSIFYKTKLLNVILEDPRFRTRGRPIFK